MLGGSIASAAKDAAVKGAGEKFGAMAAQGLGDTFLPAAETDDEDSVNHYRVKYGAGERLVHSSLNSITQILPSGYEKPIRTKATRSACAKFCCPGSIFLYKYPYAEYNPTLRQLHPNDYANRIYTLSAQHAYYILTFSQYNLSKDTSNKLLRAGLLFCTEVLEKNTPKHACFTSCCNSERSAFLDYINDISTLIGTLQKNDIEQTPVDPALMQNIENLTRSMVHDFRNLVIYTRLSNESAEHASLMWQPENAQSNKNESQVEEKCSENPRLSKGIILLMHAGNNLYDYIRKVLRGEDSIENEKEFLSNIQYNVLLGLELLNCTLTEVLPKPKVRGDLIRYLLLIELVRSAWIACRISTYYQNDFIKLLITCLRDVCTNNLSVYLGDNFKASTLILRVQQSIEDSCKKMNIWLLDKSLVESYPKANADKLCSILLHAVALIDKETDLMRDSPLINAHNEHELSCQYVPFVDRWGFLFAESYDVGSLHWLKHHWPRYKSEGYTIGDIKTYRLRAILISIKNAAQVVDKIKNDNPQVRKVSAGKSVKKYLANATGASKTVPSWYGIYSYLNERVNLDDMNKGELTIKLSKNLKAYFTASKTDHFYSSLFWMVFSCLTVSCWNYSVEGAIDDSTSKSTLKHSGDERGLSTPTSRRSKSKVFASRSDFFAPCGESRTVRLHMPSKSIASEEEGKESDDEGCASKQKRCDATKEYFESFNSFSLCSCFHQMSLPYKERKFSACFSPVSDRKDDSSFSEQITRKKLERKYGKVSVKSDIGKSAGDEVGGDNVYDVSGRIRSIFNVKNTEAVISGLSEQKLIIAALLPK